jgi:hypothetical protein
MVSKLAKALVLGLVFVIALPAVAAGASQASKYNSWKKKELVIFSHAYRDYQQLIIDINDNASLATGNADFNAIAGDARAFNEAANSPDTTLNMDLSTVAVDMSDMVSKGRAVINNNASATPFTNAVSVLNAAENKADNRIKFDNSRW